MHWKVLRLVFASLLLPAVALAANPASRITFIFALYFTPEPAASPDDEFAALLKGEFHELNDVAAVMPFWRTTAELPPPSEKSLRFMSVEVDDAQGAAARKSSRVFCLLFTAPPEHILKANRLANALVGRLAEKTGALPWDDECRLLYSAPAWRERRIDSWEGDIPDMRREVNRHSYRNPELVRVITVGMSKFNLPDLVLTEVSPGSADSAANTIIACSQALVEGAWPDQSQLALDFTKLRHAKARAYQQANPRKGASGRVDVSFRNAPLEEGDANNRLWALDFPNVAMPTLSEREGVAFDRLYGADDVMFKAKHGDPEMIAARDKARAAFLANEANFRKGLPYNERLLVKKAFQVAGNTEYMWVEVVRWNPQSVEGLLANDSFYDAKMRTGLKVTVTLDEVYDYLYYKADGSEQGNETGKVLMSREGK